MSVGIFEPQVFHELDLALNALSHKAVKAEIRDSQEALTLVQEFEGWASQARTHCGDWSIRFHDQSQQLINDIQNGLPAAKVMEQLLRTLLQAHKQLEAELTGEREKNYDLQSGTLLAHNVIVEKDGEEDLFYIRPEDRGLFQMFLQEAPSLLSGIQSNLMLLRSNKPADLQRLFQLFHFLKEQWGFLGFFQMRQLCFFSESLLDLCLTNHEILASDQLDSLLKILASCRSQVDRIANGLSKERVEIWDAEPELAKIYRQVSDWTQKLELNKQENIPKLVTMPILETGQPFNIQKIQMDELMGLLADLTLSQTAIMDQIALEKPEDKAPVITLGMSKAIRKITDLFLSIQMVSAHPLFELAEWAVNDFSLRTGKKIKLLMEGLDVTLDREMLGLLTPPLLQLIKNALEHGIEDETERLALGKSPEGMLRLKAFHQAGSFLLEVEDDGRGVNIESLKEKGKALHFLSDEKASTSRLLEMIFKPGAALSGSDEEGRNRGLDQVESLVESFHGSIHVQSRPGQGCKFVLKVPKSLFLIEGWVVEAGQKQWLLPISQVRKITHPSPSGSEKIMPLQKLNIPSLDLGTYLWEEEKPGVPKFSVHMEIGSRQFRILVDEVKGKQQVLLNKPTAINPQKPGIGGEVILMNGKIGYVLNTREFLKSLVNATEEEKE